MHADGSANLEGILALVGEDAEVPVADCGSLLDGSHCKVWALHDFGFRDMSSVAPVLLFLSLADVDDNARILRLLAVPGVGVCLRHMDLPNQGSVQQAIGYLLLRRANGEKGRLLYLKDWHLANVHPEADFYRTPDVFLEVQSSTMVAERKAPRYAWAG